LGSFSLTQTGNEKFKIATAIPRIKDATKRKAKFPTVLTTSAPVSVASAKAIIRFVPPNLETIGINSPVPAKHKIDSDVRKEAAKELM
jgi:hypothetical protein